MTEAFVCDAIRTPIGRYGGALSTIRADDLAALPIAALIERNPGVDWAAVDDVILGCANQAGEDNRNVARMAALLAGLPQSVGGITVNRLCASGLEAVGSAARAILLLLWCQSAKERLGRSKVVIFPENIPAVPPIIRSLASTGANFTTTCWTLARFRFR